MRWKSTVVGGLLLAAALGCEKDDPVLLPDGGTAATTARLRVIHAAPQAPAVDVYQAGSSQVLIDDLDYGSTSDYLEVPAGDLVVEIRAFDAPASDPAVFSTTLSLTAGQTYTALAAGLLGSTDASNSFRVLAFMEGFAAPTSGQARVRVVHAGPDAPTVGIDVGNDDPANPEIPALERFEATGADGVPLPADTTLQLGITDNGTTLTAFTIPPLPDNGQLFVIATGLLSQPPRADDGFVLLAVTEDQALPFIRQNPTVFGLHASPDAPAIDVFVGSVEVVDDLSYSQLTAPLQVPPGDLSVDLFPHQPGNTRPSGGPVATFQTPTLEAGQRYLAIVSGFVAPTGTQQMLQLITLEEEFDIDNAVAEIRAVHASPDAPEVDVGALTNGTFTAIPELSGLSFGESSAAQGLPLPPGMVTVGIAPTGTTTAVAAFPVDLTAGLRAFAVAVGAVSPSSPMVQPFGLVAVRTEVFPWVAQPLAPTAPPPPP